MYPTIQQDASGVLQVPSSGNANAYYPTVGMRPSPTPGAQQNSASSYSNGPSRPSTSQDDAAQQNFPMLRVQVAEQFRTMPPVMVNPGLDDIKRSTFHYDFDYERKVAAEYGIDDSHDSEHNSSASSTELTNLQVEDPWTSEFLKYKELGFSHEEVGMALGALGPDADQDSQFLDFCKHYRELRSMGFPAATIAGALVSHNCDIAAATEACLAAQ
ncbi:g6402 [Coccomyxa viridis]|uniref:G6402 protein n=1 Tax=Coccomyxa viridis TaxID=1274662 RepID=A0ABP1FWK5_9CHLO